MRPPPQRGTRARVHSRAGRVSSPPTAPSRSSRIKPAAHGTGFPAGLLTRANRDLASSHLIENSVSLLALVSSPVGKGVAGATTGAGVGLPLLLLVVALLDDLAHATTAAPVVIGPLNSVHPADAATPAHLPSRSPDDYPFAPRPFRWAIERASSPNDVGSEGDANRGTLDHLTSATRLSPSSAPSLTSPLSLASPLLLTPPLSSSSLSSSTLSRPSPSLTPLNAAVVRRGDISILTANCDNENEGIAARRGRAKRVPISKRSKLKDQPSPNFIDPWPEAWRRVNQHPLQSRKVTPVSSIDEGIRPAVRTFTPLLEPVFKFGESILRPESSLRDILLHESASKTTATTTTAVVATVGTIARNVAYLGATQRAGSAAPEKNDVGRVTEDRVEGDKSGNKLVLVGNEDNGAVVVGGDSVIEWTTTTVAGPMSSSRSAFSGDDVQVAERVRVRASSERSSSKGEEDDEEQITVTIARDNEDSFASSTTTTTTTTQHPPLTQDTSMEALGASGYIVSAALVLIVGALVGVLATISRHLHHRRLLVHEPVPAGSASSASASILHHYHRHHHHRHRHRREEPPPPPLQRCLLLQDHYRYPDTPVSTNHPMLIGDA
ncbi:PREDICTED: uncharacterized protein LOC105570343 [Vollenhovia emeryi]|uniref:uncharacterized protein LOC105570343 n=1 Tax=Vollenhovia emeryi TaxID=411798 RepID=UPI0005F4ECD9|nr:PREDICTED: uncharacterized protein LOC105570343 [Vollenhovia emeryi]